MIFRENSQSIIIFISFWCCARDVFIVIECRGCVWNHSNHCLNGGEHVNSGKMPPKAQKRKKSLPSESDVTPREDSEPRSSAPKAAKLGNEFLGSGGSLSASVCEKKSIKSSKKPSGAEFRRRRQQFDEVKEKLKSSMRNFVTVKSRPSHTSDKENDDPSCIAVNGLEAADSPQSNPPTVAPAVVAQNAPQCDSPSDMQTLVRMCNLLLMHFLSFNFLRTQQLITSSTVQTDVYHIWLRKDK